MSDRLDEHTRVRQALSALADGEASLAEVNLACAAWKSDAQARAAWHDYQLIGEAMRSDDIAIGGSAVAFLAGVRARMTQEPVVLSPHASAPERCQSAPPARGQIGGSNTVTARGRRWAWAAPIAVAASFVMVVGGLVSGLSLPGDLGPGLVQHMAAQRGGERAAHAAGLPQAPSGGVQVLAFGPEAHELAGLSVPGASFSHPEPVAQAVVRDALADPGLVEPRASVISEVPFAAPANLAKSAVFALP